MHMLLGVLLVAGSFAVLSVVQAVVLVQEIWYAQKRAKLGRLGEALMGQLNKNGQTTTTAELRKLLICTIR
jgi:hypothetical protein